MKKIALILALSLGGCGARVYNHTIYTPTGKVAESYHVTIIDNLFDSKSTAATVTLPDHATLTITGATSAPDPNAIAAIQGIANAIITAGTVALKFLGVP